MSGREAGGDGGDARPSAGEHLPLVGEFCIYRDRLGKESNVKMIARDLNFVPPSCAIACYRDGKEKQQVATIKQEWFGRIRPLPLPLSAERQRNLLLSLPEVFDTCEDVKRSLTARIQKVAATIKDGSSGDVFAPTKNPRSQSLAGWAGGAAATDAGMALQSKMKTILRTDRSSQDLNDEGPEDHFLGNAQGLGDRASTSVPLSSVRGRDCAQEEVAQRLEFDARESAVKLNERHPRHRFPAPHAEEPREAPATSNESSLHFGDHVDVDVETDRPSERGAERGGLATYIPHLIGSGPSESNGFSSSSGGDDRDVETGGAEKEREVVEGSDEAIMEGFHASQHFSQTDPEIGGERIGGGDIRGHDSGVGGDVALGRDAGAGSDGSTGGAECGVEGGREKDSFDDVILDEAGGGGRGDSDVSKQEVGGETDGEVGVEVDGERCLDRGNGESENQARGKQTDAASQQSREGTKGVDKKELSVKKLGYLKISKINEENLNKIENNISCKDIKIAIPSSVRELGHLQEGELKLLCKALAKNVSTERLDLEGCGITDKGCKVICDLFKSNSTIKKLDLQKNLITDQGCRLFSEIQRPLSLKELYLNCNNISDDAIDLLRKALGSLIEIKGDKGRSKSRSAEKALKGKRRRFELSGGSSDGEEGEGTRFKGKRAKVCTLSSDDEVSLIPADARPELDDNEDAVADSKQDKHPKRLEYSLKNTTGSLENQSKNLHVAPHASALCGSNSNGVHRAHASRDNNGAASDEEDCGDEEAAVSSCEAASIHDEHDGADKDTGSAERSPVLVTTDSVVCNLDMTDKVKKLVDDIILSRNRFTKEEIDLGHRGETFIPCKQFRFIFNAVLKREVVTTRLDLVDNPQLGDEGVELLAKMLLKEDCKLTWIDLSQGSLTNKAIEPLFEGLRIAKTVEYVDLRRNRLNAEGWRDIEERLKQFEHNVEIAILRKEDLAAEGRDFDVSLFSAPHQDSSQYESDSEHDLDGNLSRLTEQLAKIRQDVVDCADKEAAKSRNEAAPVDDRGKYGARIGVSKNLRLRSKGSSLYSEADSEDDQYVSSDRDDFRMDTKRSGKDVSRRGFQSVGSSSSGCSSGEGGRKSGSSSGTAKRSGGSGSELSQKKQKDAKGNPKPRGVGGTCHRVRGGGRGSSNAPSIVHKNGPDAYGFGNPPTGASGVSAKSSAQQLEDRTDAARIAQPRQQAQGGIQQQQHSAPSSSLPSHSNGRGALTAASGAGGSANIDVSKSKHSFPRSMPLQTLKSAVDTGLHVKTQWLVPEQLEQRHMHSIQRNERWQTFDEGFSRCQILLENLFDKQFVNAHGWDAAAAVNFFEYVRVELRNMSANTATDLVRTQSYVRVLRHSNAILVRGGSLVKGLEDPEGRLPWLKLYTQLNFYMLKWLQAMEGPAWKDATSVASVRSAAEEDGIDLRQKYSFTQHSSRLLRVLLFIADSHEYSPTLLECLRQRLTHGRNHRPSATDEGIESLLELWAGIIRLQDCAEKEENKFWQSLSLIFDESRCHGPNGYFYFTVPHLQSKVPTMTKSTEALEYSALLSNSKVLCAKEAALEFWWVVTALSTLLYYIHDIDRVGGWEMLSRLLAHSPLMPKGGSNEYETGKVFQEHEDAPPLDAVALDNKKTEHLLEIIDRCSLMATLWPQATTGVSSSTFGSGHLLHDLEKLASGTVLKSNKYFLSELWRLATAIAENKQQTRQYASDEDLARVGKLPDNYPFCSQQEAVDWIKDNGGGHRTLCSAVTWLIQNLVLQTQTKIGERQFEKDFMRLDGSLRQLRFFETTPQLHLDPALGNESETRSCSSHQQLRVCRSKWLLMSVMMQLAPEKHRDQIHGFLSKSMPVIPEKVNLNWHVIIELINMDKLLRISFITVCYRNLDYLAHGEHPLPFIFEAAALQKMLKLAVEEVSSEDFHYQQGLDVSTRDQTIRHKASLVPAQGANANHLSAALQAKDQANFFTKRKASAREVIKLLLLKMGQFVRKWLGDCEIKIKKNKNVPSANGHLVLFGAELHTWLSSKASECPDDLSLAIWTFLGENSDKLNEVNQNIYSDVKCKSGAPPPPAGNAQPTCASDSREEDEESFDWDAAEKGYVSEEGVRDLSIRLTNDIFTSGKGSVLELYTTAIGHLKKWLKDHQERKDDEYKAQAVQTFASITLMFLRNGIQTWNDLKPTIISFNKNSQGRRTWLDIICRMLQEVRSGESLDSRWLVPDVKHAIFQMYFITMFDRPIKEYSKGGGGGGAQADSHRHVLHSKGGSSHIFKLAENMAHMPGMARVHEAMTQPIESNLRRPQFPHLYASPRAPTGLLVLSDETSNAEGTSHFRQRIQGLRQFADGLAAHSHNVDNSGTDIIQTQTVVDVLTGWKEFGQDWKKAVVNEGKEVGTKDRVVYQLYCLEAFAVLVPSCAVYLQKESTLSGGNGSNALLDLFKVHLFDTLTGELDLRLLAARTACVPAAVLALMQLKETSKNKRLLEEFISLFSLVLGQDPVSESVASAPIIAVTKKETMLEVFSLLFLRDTTRKNCSENVLQRPSESKVACACVLNKLLILSLFQTLAKSSDAEHKNAVRACAAAEVVKELLKFLERSRSQNSASVSLETVERILNLTAKQLSECVQTNDTLRHCLWLMDIADEALKTLASILPPNTLDAVIADACAGPYLSNRALLFASLKLITCHAALTVCGAFPPADGKDGEEIAALSLNLAHARQALSQVPDTDTGDAVSGPFFDSVRKKGGLPLDDTQSSAILDDVKRLSNRNLVKKNVCQPALRVLKRLERDFGEAQRRLVVESLSVPYMAGLVSRSSTTDIQRNLCEFLGSLGVTSLMQNPVGVDSNKRQKISSECQAGVVAIETEVNSGEIDSAGKEVNQRIIDPSAQALAIDSTAAGGAAMSTNENGEGVEIADLNGRHEGGPSKISCEELRTGLSQQTHPHKRSRIVDVGGEEDWKQQKFCFDGIDEIPDSEDED